MDDPLLQVLLLTASLAGLVACRLVALAATLAARLACRLVALAATPAARLLSTLRRPRVPAAELFASRQVRVLNERRLAALVVRQTSSDGLESRLQPAEAGTPTHQRKMDAPLVPTASPPVRPTEDKQDQSTPLPAPLHGKERHSALRRREAAIPVEVSDAEDKQGQSTPLPAPLRDRERRSALRRREAAAPVEVSDAEDKQGQSTPPPAPPRDGERRSALRRQGAAAPVEVSNAKGERALYSGSVLDRSRGGLCLAVPSPAAVGEVLRVRSVEYADSCPWIQVEVRHCRPDAKRWLLSCRFVEDLPWSVLLLFG